MIVRKEITIPYLFKKIPEKSLDLLYTFQQYAEKKGIAVSIFYSWDQAHKKKNKNKQIYKLEYNPTFRKEEFKLPKSVLTIIFANQKFYIFSKAFTPSGILVDYKPVKIVKKNREEILKAIESIERTQQNLITLNNEKGFSDNKDLVLDTTGYDNWSSLSKDALTYTITRYDQSLNLHFYKCDEVGRWNEDISRFLVFENKNDLENLVDCVLDDVEQNGKAEA